MAAWRDDTDADECGKSGQAFKRRGILAAAGAVVVGLMARQTTDTLAVGPAFMLNNNDTVTNVGTTTTTLVAVASYPATSTALLVSDATTVTSAVLGVTGVEGHGKALAAGLTGFGGASNAAGVEGVGGGTTGAGVLGIEAGATFPGQGLDCGVFGAGNFDGVHGFAQVGVRGTSSVTGGVGVIGEGGATGVHGESQASSNGIGVSGVYFGSGPAGIGVLGTSKTGYGVLGMSTKVGFAGLTGITTTANVPAFAGGSTIPTALAAQFNGGVFIDCTTVAGGQFVVNPMSAKFGTVQHTDGSLRLMASMEAPESWAVDIGAGKITDGKGQVTLDKDFAAVIEGGTYHVVLTPGGETNGLYVTNKSASGFAVHEQHNGMSTLDFSWVVYAHPRNQKSERLKKFEAPAPLKLDIPKVPEAPKPPKP